MKLEGSHTISAPRSVVWEMLQDPDVLAQATPGAKSMEKEGEDAYKATLDIGIGPVRGTFDGRVHISDKDEPEAMTLNVQGQGGPGGIKAVGRLRLEDKGDQTVIHWAGEPQISGRLAAVGARLVGGVAKKMAGQFFDSIDKQAQGYQATKAAKTTA